MQKAGLQPAWGWKLDDRGGGRKAWRSHVCPSPEALFVLSRRCYPHDRAAFWGPATVSPRLITITRVGRDREPFCLFRPRDPTTRTDELPGTVASKCPTSIQDCFSSVLCSWILLHGWIALRSDSLLTTMDGTEMVLSETIRANEILGLFWIVSNDGLCVSLYGERKRWLIRSKYSW